MWMGVNIFIIFLKNKVQQFDIVQVYKNKRLNLCIVTLIFYLS